MKKHVALAFMLFSLVTVANSNIKLDGSLEFLLDKTLEKDGNPWYSMNGDVFGTGDWKQSTNDNWNDNRDKFQAILNLNSEIRVSDRVKFNVSFEGLVDELNGKLTGSEETPNQEFATVRDNPTLVLKEINAEIDTDLGKLTLTNSFNFNFNERILATQFEDNNNNTPLPYGEGFLIERDKMRAFLFQSTKGSIEPNTARKNGANVNGHNDYKNSDKADTKMVYGFEYEKGFGIGNMNFLLINEHDRSTEIKGENHKKSLNNLWLAVGGEFELTSDLVISGEYIHLKYGSDVKEVMNSTGQASWEAPSYELNRKNDSDILELNVMYNVTNDLQVKLGYKSVGENYTAVLGNSQKKDSWMGDASFNYEDGLGYEEGYNAEINYVLPFDLLIKTKLEYKDYDLTRSALANNEETKEKELKGTIDITEDRWRVEASYRRKTLTNSGSGTAEKTDLVYSDYNFNGNYLLINSPKLETNVNFDLNYYTGDDNTINQNFSNESRIKVGTISKYKLSDEVTLIGSYNFGYATEDNNVVSGSAMQNMIKLGVNYRISNDTFLDLFYKYDNYKYSLDATTEQLTNSVYKKEVEHRWYDGLESWDHGKSPLDWIDKKDIPETYKGYETHQIKASLTIRF